MDLRDLRAAFAPALRPVRRQLAVVGRLRRRVRYFRDGIEGIAMELRGAIDCAPILREYGAVVGRRVTVLGPLHVMNAEANFSRLRIGDDVYIGTDSIIDLADTVTIGRAATLSMRCTIVTHIDVGPGPLKERIPPRHGPVVIEDGAYLGTGVTVLHGVTVGAVATVGAGALVRKNVAPGATLVAAALDAPARAPREGAVT